VVQQTLNRFNFIYFMENIIVGLIALALFVYLIVAMVYPEKF
jgi:K+-transporting ATPase KdpF subunit